MSNPWEWVEARERLPKPRRQVRGYWRDVHYTALVEWRPSADDPNAWGWHYCTNAPCPKPPDMWHDLPDLPAREAYKPPHKRKG